jgi:hypothetical protein
MEDTTLSREEVSLVQEIRRFTTPDTPLEGIFINLPALDMSNLKIPKWSQCPKSTNQTCQLRGP